MIAECAGRDIEHAFGAICTDARHHNARLADVARDIIAGTLTPADLDRR